MLTKPTYIEYLEQLVLSMLIERGTDREIPAKTGNYSPYNILCEIRDQQDCRAGISIVPVGDLRAANVMNTLAKNETKEETPAQITSPPSSHFIRI